MCLLVVLSRTDPVHPLVVAANRDEKLDRPAMSSAVLADRPRVIGGRDLLAGGTWLAVNEHGVVTGLTNRPAAGGRDPAKRSRGELPLALAAHHDAPSAVDEFVGRFRPADYNSAWILVGDRQSLFYLELGEDATIGVEELAPGLHILGNGPLHGSSPKTDLVRGRVEAMEPARALGELPSVLSDHTVPPTVAAAAGSSERPKELASACVHTETFGTRSAALVQVPTAGRPHMWVADGPPCTAPFASVDHLWDAPAEATDATAVSDPH